MSPHERATDAAPLPIPPDETGRGPDGGRPAEPQTLESRRRGRRRGSGTADDVTEQLAQLSSAAVKLRSHRSGGGVHDRRDLLITETLAIGVVPHVAKPPRQRLHCRL